MNSAANQFRFCLIVIGIICFGLLGNGNAADGHTKTKATTEVARLGRAFNLRVGQQVTLKGERLRIKFVAVEGDSRCPKDVTCIWAGNAAVQLVVTTSAGGEERLTLNTGRGSSLAGEARYLGYTLELVDLRPYPRSTQKIAAGDYVVTLLVSKR